VTITKEDARTATQSFWSVYPTIVGANSVTAENPFSLVGTALLRPGLSTDLGLPSCPSHVNVESTLARVLSQDSRPHTD